MKLTVPIWVYDKLNKSYTFQMLFSKMRSASLYKKYYNKEQTDLHVRRGIVWIADGKMLQGGLCDRLWGIITTYSIAKKLGLPFYIKFQHPFSLENYLIPNYYNWEIEDSHISYRHGVSYPYFLPDISKPVNYKKLENRLDKLSYEFKQIHVYTNVKELSLNFSSIYQELFKPSLKLQEVIDHTIACSSFKKYISISFRFMDLLGDFKDIGIKALDSEHDKEQLMAKCINGIEAIKQRTSIDMGILITADSNIFLNKIKNIPNVFIIPGEIKHMGFTNDDDESHLKTFLDLYMISRAEKVYLGYAGRMYKNSFFARTAAMIGGKQFEVVNMN